MISERLRKLAEGARDLEILETTAREEEPETEPPIIYAETVEQGEDTRP
jgi:hypothetical protein